MSRKLLVKVIPRSSCDKVVGMEGDHLKVRLCAPPVDGAANDSLREVLAAHFHLKRSQIKILRGENSRLKLVEIDE